MMKINGNEQIYFKFSQLLIILLQHTMPRYQITHGPVKVLGPGVGDPGPRKQIVVCFALQSVY